MAQSKVPPTLTLHQIFEQELRFVWRSLRWSGVAEADREDLAQEVFIVVQKLLPGYDERGALRSWLFSIVRRVAADHRKLARNRNEVVRDDALHPAASDEGRLQARAELSRLQAALDAIDPAQRDVFVLYEIEGMSMADIAAATETPLQTCYSRLHAARQRVAHTFEGESP